MDSQETEAGERGEADESSASGNERSGQFSRDPVFDPEELFEVVRREEDMERVLAAMREFRDRGDYRLFERAVAVYVRSARARGEPVESVLAALEQIADELERDASPGFTQRDTPMRYVVLRGVLLAFYGADVVHREESARRDRIDRRKHLRPEPPADATP